MKKWHEAFPCDFSDPITDEIFSEQALILDIETTGFSPAHTQIYLIGCAARKGNRLIVDQFFAECASDEKDVLLAFLSLLEEYDTLITYNGLGFDIPYLKAKCDSFDISQRFSDYTYIDIFKAVSQLKFLLKLPDYKLKSVEAFLGISRNDTKTGGDLIGVYKEYLKNPDKDALFYLKQHNFEDVAGLPALFPLLAYMEFWGGKYSVVSIEGNEYADTKGAPRKELFINLKNDYIVPKRVSCCNSLFYLTMYKEKTQIRIPLYEGELKFFFPDYKNYYYLPNEDHAVHKSIGAYTDRKYRIQATAANCYTRKYALFVPQRQEIMKPLFRENPKDRLTYFELTNDFIESDIMLRRYTDHILKSLSGKKQ